MCAKWNDKFAPKTLLDTVQKSVRLGDNGEVCFDLGYLFSIEQTLISAIEFSEGIPSAQFGSLVSAAIKVACRKSNFSPGYVLQALSRAENEYLSRPSCRYVLITSVSLRHMPPPLRRNLEDCRIILREVMPKSFSRTVLASRNRTSFAMPLTTDYLCAKVEVSARTPQEAADRSLRSLGVMVGIWNYMLSGYKLQLGPGSNGVPLGGVVLGPVHTLHHPSGELATDIFWGESSYVGPLKDRANYSRQTDELLKLERRILRHCSTAREQHRLRSVFHMYADALSEPNMDTAFLKLWSVLEQLTDTTEGTKEKTLKRVAFLFDDQDYPIQELRHIRDRRNRLVHASEASTHRQWQAVQLKRYVDLTLNFLLAPRNARRSFREIGEFLDSPREVDAIKAEVDAIKAKIRILKEALKFRSV